MFIIMTLIVSVNLLLICAFFQFFVKENMGIGIMLNISILVEDVFAFADFRDYFINRYYYINN